ncbi:methionyl-tRNA formyltransferase [Gloeocapsa sp. PCC 73106]|uniref:methionyl-tRNA formyltransferase n=1 Tax=Gloeocapsa sp. PCC 73106 TaxID=102232 RepID=UPI0002ACDFDB|nr:methionyl-tRNA formyltransferase [Gloeocapsa sp. PCC 73106]ELR98336.1 methionyl-tRNA formyltransferase [Gloeocapsa sp. PCC 73106]
MRLVFFGTPQFAVPSLEALLQHQDLEVIAVVTQPDKRRGRGSQLTPSPVKQVAIAHNLPVWQPKRLKKDTDTLVKLQQVAADCFVVVAYGQILSQQVLSVPKFGCVNVHGSILPKYRGAAPIQWSIYHGDRQTGITTMLMDKGMDTGPMLLKSYLDIGLLDNAHQLAHTLANQGAELLLVTLLKLEEITPIPQDETQASYAPLLEKSDYLLDWQRSAIALHNQIRAFFPNCFTSWRNQELKITASIPLEGDLPPEISYLPSQYANTDNEIGAIVALVKNFGPIMQTRSGLLLLTQLQLAGKRSQSGWDFINGTRLQVGEKLI